MNLAPIVLFTYNRLSCLQQTIEALQQNDLAIHSDLFIYSDGSKNELDRPAVEEVRQYIKSISGFKKIEIVERDRNWGLAENIIGGVTAIINKYEKIIVLEDDLVTGPYFLRFMNDALNIYENENEVICINGYGYLDGSDLPETYFIKTADNLGWATWKRGWDLFECDGKKLLNEIKSKRLRKRFDRDNVYPFTLMLQNQVNDVVGSWAIRWYASAFLKNKYTLYPKHSLVLHIGVGDQATNYKNIMKTDPLSVNLYHSKINVVKREPKESKKVSKLYHQFLGKYKGPFYIRAIRKAKRILLGRLIRQKEEHRAIKN
jgi:hypothetical protein